MENNKSVQFVWNKETFQGIIEKEYENTFLLVVTNPSTEITDKYMNRMVISKKCCQFPDEALSE